MTLTELEGIVDKKSALHPTLAGEFNELLQLAKDECEDECASEESECQLCLSDINDLIEQDQELPF